MRTVDESGDALSATPRAVLLMAYGGPDSLDDVEPFLLDVRGGRPTSPELIAEIRRRYARIGGRSPLLEITLAQARALEELLNRDAGRATERGADGRAFRVYVGMRHWRPYVQEAIARIAGDGLRDVLALCLAPHYSRMSVGAYFQKVREAQTALGIELNVTYVDSWHDQPLFVQALADKLTLARGRFSAEDQERIQVVFTAHSLPAALVEQGDPYEAQFRETARLVAERACLRADSWRACYQSAGAGQARWLGPRLDDVVVELAEAGVRQILVAPIGAVADNLELLHDIDVVTRGLAERAGAQLERTDSLNGTPLFIAALADIVRRNAQGA